MILSGDEIIKQVAQDAITISPFNEDQVTTNSYDFRLQDKLLIYTDSSLDVKKNNQFRVRDIPKSGVLLEAGQLYLGATVEKMGSSVYVPIIKGRSSIARLGLFIHATADLIDLGSINQWTLQLIPTLPVRIYPNMRIGQVTFWSVMGDKHHQYAGKYSDSVGPVASKSYLDYSVENNVT